MNTLASTFASPKILYSGLGFVLIIVSGMLLSRFGRPLNSAIFTVHKLIAVGSIILFALGLINFFKDVDVRALYLATVAIAGLLILGLVVSGALLSFDKLAVPAVLRVHQLLPLLALAFSTISVYLLVSSRV
jgi:hypothetical protein